MYLKTTSGKVQLGRQPVLNAKILMSLSIHTYEILHNDAHCTVPKYKNCKHDSFENNQFTTAQIKMDI